MFEFINTYGLHVIGILVLALCGGMGMLLGQYLNTETKQIIARNAMLFVEQTIKDLHGEGKMLAALTAAAKMLTKKGIKFDADEMRMLIEAALGEFNKSLNKAAGAEIVTE